MKKSRIKVLDTTLRDGEQAPGYAMSVDEKVRLAQQLVRLRVDAIEAGFPVSSYAQYEAVRRIANYSAERKRKGQYAPKVVAFGRAAKGDIDKAYSSLGKAIEQGIGRIHIFISTSPVHMKRKLKKTPNEVLDITRNMVAYAKRYCKDVELSLEDAARTDENFMIKVIRTALENGAKTINVPDTVGYDMCGEYGRMIKVILSRVPEFRKGKAVLSVHCHNDVGQASANTLEAIRAGVMQVECTINGIGERAGNASLEEVVMAMKVRPDLFRVYSGVDIRQIYRTSRMVCKITGQEVQPNKAIVGANAFAHEAGIHQHGVCCGNGIYEIIDPKSVGRKSEFVIGRHSGYHGVANVLRYLGFKDVRAKEFMPTLNKYADKVKTVSRPELKTLYGRWLKKQ